MGMCSIPEAKPVSYTHSFVYSSNDFPNDTLRARIRFDSNANNAGSNQGQPGLNVAVDTDFIEKATFTYTASGQESLVLQIEDMISFTITHLTEGNTDFSTDLTGQLTNLQFTGSGAFTLTSNAGGNFELDADNGIGSGADFELDSMTYVSPGPLPLLGLIPAITSISRLKKRYELKNLKVN